MGEKARKPENGSKPKKSKFKVFLNGFIPKHVSNKVVVDTYDFMRKMQHIVIKDYTKHEQTNIACFEDHRDAIDKANGYIEDQKNYSDMRYGKKTMRFCGCEIIATYNALYSIHGDNPISLPEMISEYERDGMVLSGYFGTSPIAIKKYLDRHGYDACFSIRPNEFDAIGEKYETTILTIYNDGTDIMKAVHTVNVTKSNLKYYAHNVNSNGRVEGPFDSITALMSGINKGKSKAISLIGVSKKADEV